jgi:threonylcarbamoyladenosine tRNA methylthiotransferase MtaB
LNSTGKIAFYTLGCKLNFAETSSIARLMTDNKFEKVKFNSKADYYFINTCCVTESAEKKSRNMINRAIAKSPDSVVIVSGCYAQLQFEKLSKTKGINLILGNNEKFRIIDYLENYDKSKLLQVHVDDEIISDTFQSSFSLDERTRSFLKVQDGCDYKCSYCTVPHVRGNSRNAFIKDVVNQAKKIAKEGINEIILTGINIGDFGKSTNETFYQLITELENLKGIIRFRISSIEPDLLTNEIIEFISNSEKFVHHFHIPLQSGSDNILKSMKRRYTTDYFSDKIKLIKALLPHAAVGVDIITGFPGESEEEFLKTYNFIKSLDISYLHVFTYSERPETEALKLNNKVLQIEKSRRSKLLHNLSDVKRNLFYKTNLGKIHEVLFESENHNGKLYGFTGNYIKTIIPFDPNLTNKIVKVKLVNIVKSGMVSAEI